MMTGMSGENDDSVYLPEQCFRVHPGQAVKEF